MRCFSINNAIQVLVPLLDPRLGSIKVIGIFNKGPASRTRIYFSTVLFLKMIYKIDKIFFMIIPAWFISISHHYKRWMVPVGIQNSLCFFVQPFVYRFLITNTGPCRSFYLQINTCFVCSSECSFRGTPGMETHMV